MTRCSACHLCGKDPAAGFATVDDKRYCHGDLDPDPTCYMQAQRRLTRAARKGKARHRRSNRVPW